MNKHIFAGIDFGTTRTKMVYGPDLQNLTMVIDPFGEKDSQKTEAIVLAGRILRDWKCRHVAVVGSRSRDFDRLESDNIIFYCHPEDPKKTDAITHELELQARGVQHLLGPDMEREFLLVSLGSGTSFVLVKDGVVRRYLPGLSTSSRTVLQLAASRGIAPESIDTLALAGEDPDLLLKHVYTTLPFPESEFVIASMGRLGREVADTDANFCAGLMKMMVVPVIGHIFSMMQNPASQWNGPVVYIGSPVEHFRSVRDHLTKFTSMMGLSCLIPPHAAFAGAMGAYLHAQKGHAYLEERWRAEQQ